MDEGRRNERRCERNSDNSSISRTVGCSKSRGAFRLPLERLEAGLKIYNRPSYRREGGEKADPEDEGREECQMKSATGAYSTTCACLPGLVSWSSSLHRTRQVHGSCTHLAHVAPFSAAYLYHVETGAVLFHRGILTRFHAEMAYIELQSFLGRGLCSASAFIITRRVLATSLTTEAKSFE